MTNQHVDDLIEEYALGLLSEAETAQVEAHTATCAACRAELDAALRTAAMLAAIAPTAEPPSAARDRLLSRVGRARRPETRPDKTAGNRLVSLGAGLWPAAAGLGLALAVAMLAWNVALQTQLQLLQQENANLSERLNRQERRIALVSGPGVAVVEMSGTDEAPGSQGRAYLDQATGTVWVTVSGLPPVDNAWTYQIWLIGPQGPVSAGFLTSTDGGQAEAWLSEVPGLTSTEAVGVSLEQAGGSDQPTRVMVVGGK